MQESAIKTAGTRRHDPDFRNQAVSHTGLLHALSPIRVGLIGLDIKFITGSSLDDALRALDLALDEWLQAAGMQHPNRSAT